MQSACGSGAQGARPSHPSPSSVVFGFRAAEKWFSDLKSPVRRIGLPDVPTPAGYGLEQFFYPTADNIAETVREMCVKKWDD